MTPPVHEDSTETRILLARLETKLDLVIGQHGTRLTDHETRIRVVEARPYVTPKGLVAALVSAASIFGGAAFFIDRMTGVS